MDIDARSPSSLPCATVNGVMPSAKHVDDASVCDSGQGERTFQLGDQAAANDAATSPKSRSSSLSTRELSECDNATETLPAAMPNTAMEPPASVRQADHSPAREIRLERKASSTYDAGGSPARELRLEKMTSATFPLSAAQSGDSPAREPQLDTRSSVERSSAGDKGAALGACKDEGIRESALIRKISGVGLSSQRPSPPDECCICGSPPKMLDHSCIVCSATTCSGCVINLRHLACPYCHDIERNANELRNEAITIKAVNKASKWFSAAKGVFRGVADNVMVRASKKESQENESWRRTYESDYGVDYAGFGIGPNKRNSA